MKILEAAEHVLIEAGTPLHASDLTKLMLDGGHWASSGQTPAATVQACIAVEIKENPATSHFLRTAPATFGLVARDAKPEVPIPLFVMEEDTRPNAVRFVDAAREVLEKHGGPLHVRTITQQAIQDGRIQTAGKTPWATMRVQIQREIDRQVDLGLAPTFSMDGPTVSLAAGAQAPQPIDSELVAIAQKIDALSPREFETLVEQVFLNLEGFSVKATPYSGDGGIDVIGTIQIKGGLELVVGIQAKHHAPGKPNKTVGRPVVQSLRGSLPPQAVGYVVTSGDFSDGAEQEARLKDRAHPVRLVAGDELARLVRKANVQFTANGAVAIPEA